MNEIERLTRENKTEIFLVHIFNREGYEGWPGSNLQLLKDKNCDLIQSNKTRGCILQ